MKILVISDYFNKSFSDHHDIDFIKWTAEEFPSPLLIYHAILIDLTIKRKGQESRKTLLFKLKIALEDRDLLKREKTTLVVVCAAENIILELRKDEEKHEFFPDDPDDHYDFNTYEFLEKIVTGYSQRFIFHKSSDIYPIALIPVNFYLESVIEKVLCQLYYDYRPDSEDCNDITPLAKIVKHRNACVAFECRVGASIVVILPPYNVDDLENSFSLLIRISRSYGRRINQMKLIDRDVYNSQPVAVREAYVETLSCYNNDLYIASLIMCRRTLEASVLEIQKENEIKIYLGNRIRDLKENGVINNELETLARYIIDFGNWGVHPNKYRGEKPKERDVKMSIHFLETYLKYFSQYQEKKYAIEKRKLELEKMEDG